MDLFYLWCFFDHRPLNLVHILSSQLSRRGYAAHRDSRIIGGHLITKLARSFRIDNTGLDVLPYRLFTRVSFSSNFLVQKVGKWEFIIPHADPVIACDPVNGVVGSKKTSKKCLHRSLRPLLTSHHRRVCSSFS